MDRRTFFSLSSGAAAALTAPTLAAEGSSTAAAAKPSASQPLKMRLGPQMGEVTDAKLAWLKRFGVEGICASATIKDPGRIHATADEMKRLRETVEKHGLTLELTDSVLLRSSLIDREPHPSIMLAQSPQRDRDIESFQNHIR